jgi:hypothetical protein
MYLFKAKIAANEEMERTLAQYGLTREQVAAWLEKHPSYASSLHKAPHTVCGSGADLVHEVAPLITKSLAKRTVERARGAANYVASNTPKAIAKAKELWGRRADAYALAKEDLAVVGEVIQGKISKEWMELGKVLLDKKEHGHAETERVMNAAAVSGMVAAAE